MKRTESAVGVRVGTLLLSLALGSAACGPVPGGYADGEPQADSASDARLGDGGVRDEGARDDGRGDVGRDDGPDAGDEGNVYSLQVTPMASMVFVGATTRFTAVATAQNMTTQDVTTTATWSSSNPAVATVDSQGRVTGVGAGTARITATWNGGSSEAVVTVAAERTLRAIVVDPPMATIASFSTLRFTVTGTFSDGSTVDVTSMATFALDRAVATLGTGADASLVTGRECGMAVLTATVGSQSATAPITVTGCAPRAFTIEPGTAIIGAGTTQRFRAVGTFNDGSMAEVTTGVVWSSSNPASATVDATGLVTGITAAAAPVTITATWTTMFATPRTATATVMVTISPVRSLVAVLEPVGNVALGGTAQIRVQGTFADGASRDLTNTPGVTYMSSSNTTATVSATGRITGTGGGTATITVAYMGQTATVPVPVTADGVTRLELRPRDGASATVSAGSTRELELIATFPDMSTRDIFGAPNVVFSSSNSRVATVSNATGSRGVVTGVASGTAVITATFSPGGVPLTAVLTITVAGTSGNCVNAIELALPAGASPSIASDETLTLTPRAVGLDGTRRDLTANVGYESSDAFTAAVRNATTGNLARGVVSAATTAAAGRVTITARYAGADLCPGRTAPLAATQDVTVSSSPLRYLIVRCTRIDPVTGAPRTLVGGRLVRGQRAQCSAFGPRADGGENPITTPTWRATGSGDISATGLVTAGTSAGTLSIEAWSGSVVGTLNIPVFDGGAPTLSITARPALPSSGPLLRINAGVRTQLVGVASYSYIAGGTPLTESYDVTDLGDWFTSQSARVEVSNAVNTRGRATGGLEAGDSDVMVAFGGALGSVTVQNSLYTLRSLRAAFGALDGPNTTTLMAGGRADLFARGEYCPAAVPSGDGDCGFWDVGPLAAFTIANTAVAAAETAGLRPQARGVSAGTTAVRATVGAITAAATLTVVPACIVSVALDVSGIRAVAAGAGGAESSSHVLRVIGMRSDGTTIVLTDPANLLWREVTVRRSGAMPSSWPEAITVDQHFTARFPSVGVGSYRAEFTGPHCGTGTLLGTPASETTVFTLAGALSSIAVAPLAPSTGSVGVGSFAQYRATGTYSIDGGGGTVAEDLTAHDRLVWSATDATIAAHTGASPGRFQGLRAGETPVTARLGTVTGTGALRVF